MPVINYESDPKQGSAISQMEQMATANPGTTIQGAKVGETAGGIPTTDITRQFLFQNNPISDFVPKETSTGVLTSNQSNEFNQRLKSDLDLRQENLLKEADTIKVAGYYRPEEALNNVPEKYRNDPSIQALVTQDRLIRDSELGFAVAKLVNKDYVEEQNRPNKERLEEGQYNQKRTQGAAEFYGGRTGTDYAKDVLGDLTREHDRQTLEFNREQQDIINKLNDSVLRGYAKRESETLKHKADLYKEYEEIQVKKEKQQEEYQKQYKESLEIQKMERELGREAEKDAGVLLDRFVKIGAEPTETQLGYIDERYELPKGTSALMYGVSRLEKEKLDAKDSEEKRDKAIESATKLVTLLDKVPIGQSVSINGKEYAGQSRGAIKSGTETDNEGNVIYWEYDQDSQEVRKTSLGNIGKAEDGWQTLNLGDDGVWRVNDKTGQAVPFYPGEATSSWEEAYPEGSTGPVLPGNPAAAGECGAACNYFYGTRIWANSKEEKRAKLKELGEVPIEDVDVGDTLLMKAGTTDHVAVVNQVEKGPDGKKVFRFTESNYNGDDKITHTRTMREDDSKIIGFTRIPTPNLPVAGTDAPSPRGNRTILGASVPGDTGVGALAESLMNGEITIADVPANERGAVLAAQKSLVKKMDVQDRADFERDYQNELGMSISAEKLEDAWNRYKGTRDTASTGKLTPETIAANIMSGVSSIRVNELPTAQRAKVDAELTRLKSEAKASGDTVGELRASAGGKDVAESFNTSFDKGVGVLQQIDQLQELIKSEKTGPITGLVRSNNPYDVKAREMKALLTSIIPNLARGVYGEVGVLTDNDVQLYSKTLPNITDTEATNKLILSATIKGVGRSLERKLKTQASAGRDVSGFVDEYLELMDRSNSLLAESDPANYRVVDGVLYAKNGTNWIAKN